MGVRMNPKLTDLKSLARRAGEILMQSFAGQIQVDRKGVIDLVTEVDHRSEAFLLQEIREGFPSHHVVTEESGIKQGDRDHSWYVDPLDGTVNYAHGVPIFSVSLAYAYQGRMTLGVVYDPFREECYSAKRGHGAWLNGEQLQVTGTADLADSCW